MDIIDTIIIAVAAFIVGAGTYWRGYLDGKNSGK